MTAKDGFFPSLLANNSGFPVSGLRSAIGGSRSLRLTISNRDLVVEGFNPDHFPGGDIASVGFQYNKTIGQAGDFKLMRILAAAGGHRKLAWSLLAENAALKLLAAWRFA